MKKSEKFTKAILTTICLAILLGNSVFGQADTDYPQHQIIIGQNLESKEDITAKCIEFNTFIAHCDFSKTEESLTVYLRKEAYSEDFHEDLIRFNMESGSILWNKTYDYRHTLYLEYDSILLKTIANKTERIDLNSGERIWSRKGANFGVDNRFNMAYLYDFKKTNNISEKLKGISLSDGSELWSREISHEYGWNSIEVFDDSIAVIASDGLHAINLNNGEGWDYNTKTGRLKNGTTAAAITLTTLFGITGGMIGVGIVNAHSYYSDVIEGPNYIGNYASMNRDLCSNVLKIGNNLYFSSLNYIQKLDFRTGEIIWKNYHSELHAGISDLFMHNGKLLHISTGAAKLMNKKVFFHRPFICMIDTTNCHFQYTTKFNNNSQYIIDYQIIEDEIIILFSTHIIKMNLINGEIIAEIDLDEAFLNFNNEFEADVAIAKKHYVQKESQAMQKVSDLMGDELYILLDGKIKYILNSKTLEIDENSSSLKIFESLELGPHHLAISDEGSYLLNEAHNPVVRLQLSDRAQLVNDKWYDISGNKIIEINTLQFNAQEGLSN